MEWRLKPGKTDEEYWAAHDAILEDRAMVIQQAHEDSEVRLRWLFRQFYDEVPEAKQEETP